MSIFRSIILFWFTSRTGLHALTLKKSFFFSKFPLRLKRSV